MKKNVIKTMSLILMLSMSLSLSVNSVLAQCLLERGTLSPKINIGADSLQKASQYVLDQNDTLPKPQTLPVWLNMEDLENLAGLKITRTITTDQVSTIDSDEGDERFDSFKFKFSYSDNEGNDYQAGEITVWKYHRPEGVRLFLHKSRRFNLRVVTFKPDLPRGKAVKELNGRVQKAGIGMSMLWLLLAQEPKFRDQQALIFNAETPSQRVFDNLKDRWDNLIFTGTPFYAKDLRLAPLVHIGFNVPRLNDGQMKAVKSFFENKIDFVDETEKKITIPFINSLSLDTPTSIETSI